PGCAIPPRSANSRTSSSSVFRVPRCGKGTRMKKLIAFVSCGLALALAAPAHATTPGTNGKIAFTSDRDGRYQLYVMNADGTGQSRLTTDAGNDAGPAWSPDGTKIAFTSNRDGNAE